MTEGTERLRTSIQKVVDSLTDARLIDGFQISVRDGDAEVLRLAGGRQVPSGRPITAETAFPVFSFSKSVTAAAFHRLATLGRVRYEDRVIDYLPEFGQAGKQDVTIHHLLAHEAGIPDVDEQIDYHDWDDAVGAICTLAPLWEPGSGALYHAGTGYQILGEVLQRLTDLPFAEATAALVLEPIGMHHSTWGRPSTRAFTSMSTPFPDNQSNIDLFVDGPLGAQAMPGATLWSTAQDMATFMAAWLSGSPERQGGWWSPEVVHGALAPRFPMTPGSGRAYARGFFVGADVDRPWAFGRDAEPSTFGHPGWCNAQAMADTSTRTSIGIAFNVAPQQDVSDERISLVVDTIRAGVEHSRQQVAKGPQ
jgi:CubicO group peptidase (beta-lactamase class C family)